MEVGKAINHLCCCCFPPFERIRLKRLGCHVTATAEVWGAIAGVSRPHIRHLCIGTEDNTEPDAPVDWTAGR